MAAAHPRVLKSACALEGMEVCTAAGERLGHLFDFRLHTDGGRAPVVTELLYGSRGLLARLGLRHAKPTTIAWSLVRAIEGNTIVVDEKAAPRPRSA